MEKKVAELKTKVAIDCGPISTIFREDMAELRQEDTFILDFIQDHINSYTLFMLILARTLSTLK